MRIGETAVRAGTTARTLRYYESLGLLRAGRDANGHRTFTEDDLSLLRQIRTLREFGFELEETRPFADCLRTGHPTADACPPAREVYRRKIAELDECIAQVQHVRDQVRARLLAAEVRAAETAATCGACSAGATRVGCDGCDGCDECDSCDGPGGCPGCGG